MARSPRDWNAREKRERRGESIDSPRRPPLHSGPYLADGMATGPAGIVVAAGITTMPGWPTGADG